MLVSLTYLQVTVHSYYNYIAIIILLVFLMQGFIYSDKKMEGELPLSPALDEILNDAIIKSWD